MNSAANVVLLMMALLAVVGGAVALLALRRSTRRPVQSRRRRSSRRRSLFGADAVSTVPGALAAGPVSAEGAQVMARIDALRATLHREHERHAGPGDPPPSFADTEVFEDDALPVITPRPAPREAARADHRPAEPKVELLKLDFGPLPVPAGPVVDRGTRSAAPTH